MTGTSGRRADRGRAGRGQGRAIGLACRIQLNKLHYLATVLKYRIYLRRSGTLPFPLYGGRWAAKRVGWGLCPRRRRREVSPPQPAPIRQAPPATFPRNGGRNATYPPIVSIFRIHNSLILLSFTKSQRHLRAIGSRRPRLLPIPSVGRASDPRSSMAAGCGRAMKPGGRRPRGSSRRSMDGLCLLAARCWMRAAGRIVATCPPRVGPGNGSGGDPARPERQGRQPEGAWKTATRSGLLRRNGKQPKHRARPGRSAPSPTACPQAANSHARSFSLPRSGEGGREATGWGSVKPGAAGAGLASPTPGLGSASPSLPTSGEGEDNTPPPR
jgi:hypothetical protein